MARLGNRGENECAEIAERIARTRRQVDRASSAVARKRLQNKLRAFETTMNAMGCRPNFGRARRRKRR